MFLLHPIIVHFAIALLSVAVIADLLYLVTRKQNFWQLTNLMLLIGILSALIAVITGNQAFQVVNVPEGTKPLVLSHQLSGQITLGLFLAVGILRWVFIRLKLFANPVKWIYYLLLIAASFFLFRTGVLGGEMVYIHGVGTKKESVKPAAKPSFQ